MNGSLLRLKKANLGPIFKDTKVKNQIHKKEKRKSNAKKIIMKYLDTF